MGGDELGADESGFDDQDTAPNAVALGANVVEVDVKVGPTPTAVIRHSTPAAFSEGPTSIESWPSVGVRNGRASC
jgi:hypothetical protein